MSRCDYCKTKKVGLIPFNCKCDYKILCLKCRLPSEHNCTYDYLKENKQRLEKQLPLIVASKINEI